LEELGQSFAVDEGGALLIDGGEALLEPSTDRVFMDAQKIGDFLHRIAAVDLDEPGVRVTLAQRVLAGAVFDQGADVLDAPDGNAGAELQRFGKATGLDPLPPSRFSDRDRTARSEDLTEPYKSGLREGCDFRHGSTPSNKRWREPR